MNSSQTVRRKLNFLVHEQKFMNSSSLQFMNCSRTKVHEQFMNCSRTYDEPKYKYKFT